LRAWPSIFVLCAASGCSVSFWVQEPDGGAVHSGDAGTGGGSAGGAAAGGGATGGGGQSAGGAGGGVVAIDAGTGGGTMSSGDAGFTDAGMSSPDAGLGDGGCSDIRDMISCQNAGCQPLICPDCINCTSTYLGCGDKSVQLPCQTTLCQPVCCGNDTTCLDADLMLICFAPNDSPCGGVACFPPPYPCLSDTDCQNHLVCQAVDCCIGQRSCVSDCIDAGCPQGERCDNDPTQAHCNPISCSLGTDCPSDSFECDGGMCQRKTCVDDLSCSDALTSYCVSGTCYDTMGTCRLATP
jgi:hypothetical protein